MSDNAVTFMAITGCEDSAMAENFLEMAGSDVETAISLYYEHGPNLGGGANNDNSRAQNNQTTEKDDIAMAERLQQEAYQAQEPRAADAATHERLVGDVFPGTWGGIGGSFNPLHNTEDLIYGRQQRGIFNQRDDMFASLSGSDDETGDEFAGMTEGQRKLALLFRPPFDIMEKVDLETAKRKANLTKKWVLVNIQDSGDFQCQTLNRDFWKSSTVKELVREHFVFVQYQKDSMSGTEYMNFYPFEKFPHIAIIDPITGERTKQWEGVPKVSKWCDEVYDFLNNFSVDPSAANPVVEHKPHEQIIASIKPVEHPEPTNATTTRIQIRLGDGTRVVRKFDSESPVRVIYEAVKHQFADKVGSKLFTLASQRENLIDKLNLTISDAGLKNASILMDIQEPEDDE
ncbi:UBX domain-containing protein 5 [Cyberlindnera fabianii]|uniref:UBX domain-containing protein 5 n=1 Tax=Cyberlindnera fabianii TaxID=36022 RepID=A0A1V2L6R9_CYBFA|nr:UBX domain-containing protein 5 [Cyberlindnera fabianii]